MHADVGRTGEHQDSLIRGNSFKSFTGRTGHVVAKQIVYLVVADLFAVYIVIKAFIVLMVVCQCLKLSTYHVVRNFRVTFHVFLCSLFEISKAFLRIEDGWLVHVIPEGIDSLGNENIVFVTKPFSGICI